METFTSYALDQLQWWITIGVLLAGTFEVFIMGPYRYAQFRRFNLFKKLGIFFWRGWKLILLWPFEIHKIVATMNDPQKYMCTDRDLFYHIPMCRYIGTGRFSHYEVAGKYIRVSPITTRFSTPEAAVEDMVSCDNWQAGSSEWISVTKIRYHGTS